MSLIGLALLAVLGVLLVARLQASGPRLEPLHAQGAAALGPADAGSGPEGFLGVIIPEEAVDISSRREGRLEKVAVQVGDGVLRGAVLAVLDTRSLQLDLAVSEAELQSARTELQAAELALSLSEERLERRQDPRQLALGAISQEELETARYEQRLAVVKRDAAKARVQEQTARVARLQQDLSEATLRAPFDGVVASRAMDPGALVRPGDRILHVLRTGARRVRFAIPEGEVAKVAVGQPVRVWLGELSQWRAGKVSNLAPEVDAAARVMLAVAELEEEGALPGGVPTGAVVRVHVAPGAGAGAATGRP
ncbi:efflux RND transporter periplasmic adaptor subunit [Pyxidicoccus sp. 3LG]